MCTCVRVRASLCGQSLDIQGRGDGDDAGWISVARLAGAAVYAGEEHGGESMLMIA